MRILTMAMCLLTLTMARADAHAQCVGDCNDDGTVEITDVIVGVNIALGLVPVAACPAFANGMGDVDIEQLIQGVENALSGCRGSLATPTSPAETTATATPPAAPGRFVDNADGTITDRKTGLMWEKKVGSSAGVDAANLHAVENTYSWSGQCTRAVDTDCQPNPSASAACMKEAEGDRSLCATCTTGEGLCDTDPGQYFALATIWDWLTQLNKTRFAGYTDWRIPTEAELESIIDYSALDPAVDDAFHGTSCGAACTDMTNAACSCTEMYNDYWSGTTAVENRSFVWTVAFGQGLGRAAFTTGAATSVRAVRGSASPPRPRFVDNADGTITDRETGLMWEKKIGLGGGVDAANVHAADNTYSWAGQCSLVGSEPDCQPNAEAADACLRGTQGPTTPCTVCCELDPGRFGALTTMWDWLAQLNVAKFAGYSDWRIPTEAELESIVDYTKLNPAVDAAFDGVNCGTMCTDVGNARCSCTQPYYYLSSTNFANISTIPWGVSFSDGFVSAVNPTSNLYLRAVRSSL